MKKRHLLPALALSLFASSHLLAAEKTLRIGIEAAYPRSPPRPVTARSSVSTTTSATPCARK